MKVLKLINFVLFFSLFVYSAIPAESALISIKNPSEKVSVGDVVVLSVLIDTENQNINVVEGDVSIVMGGDNIVIKDLSVAGSSFLLWPVKPSFSQSLNKISFTAGIPGGINKRDAILFKIILQIQAEGQIVLSPANIKAFVNDGRATPVQIKFSPITFSSSALGDGGGVNNWGKIIIGDNKKPFGLMAEIGSDSSLFEGKTFVAFSAFDNESGIDHYEVKEGDREVVRSGSIYVFQNQQKLEPTLIIAYDKAGNSRKLWLREKTTLEKINLPIIIFYSISIILLIMALFRIFKAFKDYKKNE